ncbi:MAG: hypothetical protein NZL90_04395 [Aquificaceae bacterium]|nr:hypothetical protein [Aquificaceae bacterium]
MPVPEDIKQRVIEKISNKELAKKAFEYIKLRIKDDGKAQVIENFDKTEHHALYFTVLACLNYTKRLLEGDELD